jgi:hypothetical protein
MGCRVILLQAARFHSGMIRIKEGGMQGNDSPARGAGRRGYHRRRLLAAGCRAPHGEERARPPSGGGPRRLGTAGAASVHPDDWGALPARPCEVSFLGCDLAQRH